MMGNKVSYGDMREETINSQLGGRGRGFRMGRMAIKRGGGIGG